MSLQYIDPVTKEPMLVTGSGSMAGITTKLSNIDTKVDKNNIISSVDLNSIKEVGFYYCTNCTNSPSYYGYLQVYASANSNITRFQVFTDIDSNIYKRTLLNNNWTTWKKLATSDELNSINSVFANIQTTNKEIKYDQSTGVGVTAVNFRKLSYNSMNIFIGGNHQKADGTSLFIPFTEYVVASNVNLPLRKSDTNTYACVVLDNDGRICKFGVFYKTNGDLVIVKYTNITIGWVNEIIVPNDVTFI